MTHLTLSDGTVRSVTPGEYLITTTTNHVIDVVTPATLTKQYEILQDSLSVSQAARRTLEDRLGPGTAENENTLVAAVLRATAVTLGGIALDFTPGQLEELTHRASKRGRTLHQELAAAVDAMKDQLFYGGVGLPVR